MALEPGTLVPLVAEHESDPKQRGCESVGDSSSCIASSPAAREALPSVAHRMRHRNLVSSQHRQMRLRRLQRTHKTKLIQRKR